MSKSSNSEKLSSSAFGLLVVVFLVFAALVVLMFSLNLGGGGSVF